MKAWDVASLTSEVKRHILVPLPIVPFTARHPTPWLRVGHVAGPPAVVVALWSQELVGVPP
jgi:hypothetical protein